MAKTKNLADLRKSIGSTPLIVTLEYLYSNNVSSPVATNKTAEQKYAELVKMVTDMLYESLAGDSAGNARDIPFTSFFSISEMIILSLTKSKDILINVMYPRYTGDFLACHSLNVAFLSCSVGMGMEFEYRELTEIGVAALLHDIGMTKIDEKCYLGAEELTKSQREAMERHPVLGWRFFEKLKNEFPWLLRVICEEHKREHGQGYPADVEGDLHPYSKIVGLCDSFEALTHNRIYRKAFHPADAMKAIVAAKETVFSRDVLRGMIESLSMFPVGSIVQLNNKNAAVVVESVWRSPLRPVVRIIRENDPEPSETVDLSKENNLYITGIIYNDQYQVPKDLKV
jgi:HD-GYP domain-containing protein (c-di-GMP phosphodiesterase class II)